MIEWLKDSAMYIAIGAFFSWLFMRILRKKLFGGFLSGWVLATIGAILGMFLLHPVLKFVIDVFLNGICFGSGEGRFCLTNVDIISAGTGSYLTLLILNRITHAR